MKILVTAGPTCEYIDPVRFISNPSTGKMGYAIAEQALKQGHEVVLVSGPTHLEVSDGVKRLNVVSAEEMFERVKEWLEWADGVVMSAAVSDYKPINESPNKIKKQGVEELTLKLSATQDILSYLGKNKGNKILIGFAAETDKLLFHAKEKLVKKNCDYIVANDVSRSDIGFGSEENEVSILSKDGNVETLPKMPKRQIAEKLVYLIEEALKKESLY